MLLKGFDNMKITVEGKNVDIAAGESILCALSRLGLNKQNPADKPLAAMIGGEVFNLNYAPKRECCIRLLRYGDEEGRRVYERTLQFVFILAVRRIFPGARLVMRYSAGEGLYITVEKADTGEPLTAADAELLRGEMERITAAAYPFVRRRLDVRDAIDFYTKDGQQDKADLLRCRRFSYFDVYSCPDCSDYMDYFYGEMAPSTDYVRVFALHTLPDAIVMLLPSNDNPTIPAQYESSPKLLAVFAESDKWGRLMHVANAVDLNRRVENGSIRELIRVNEALHEKTYARVADEIIARRAKAVMLAGPSSSGKTTSANRIATQLRADGLDPVMLSLDDYYIDRDRIPRDENGEMDLEHINTLDIPRFNSDLALLLDGCEAEIPRFNFKTGKRESAGAVLKLHRDQPLIIEGIHALNPLMLGSCDPNSVFRIYVSALTTLNLDDHNRIRTTDLRLLRRLVRDYETRNASMEHTLGMWASVRRGEARWIFPYQENADRILNTTLHYEVAVLKRYVYPLLDAVPPESVHYCAARGIVKFLNYFVEAAVEDEIPPTSILREFIGGNTFYK